MARTARELINSALSHIRVLEAGQTASAEDFNLVKDMFVVLLAELNENEDFYLAAYPLDAIETMEIPDGAFIGLRELLGDAVASDFGKPQLAPADRERVIDRLRRVYAAKPILDPVRACYF